MKNKLLNNLLLPLALLLGSFTYGQTVSGIVSDISGGLPGVNVLVKGTAKGVQTDFDGKYTIEGVSNEDVIIFSFLGYKTQEIVVNGQTKINVTLQEDAAELNEVVIIGYGSVSKKDATGAIEVVGAKDLNRGITTSPQELLQGRMSGVQVTTSSGEPGAPSAIRIRGASSVRAGNDPLYVIDGVPFNNDTNSPGTDTPGLGTTSAKNPLSFINSADIESITVLKDASSTAIYGSRGANGVILITTKKGKSGEGNFNFTASQTFSKIANKLDLLTASEYANLNSDSDGGASETPFDDILRSANTEEYGVSFSGGNEKGAHRISLGLLNQEGIVKNTGLDKYTLNGNFSQKFFDNDRLKIEANITASGINNHATAISESVGAEGDLMLSALKWNPTNPLMNTDGTYNQPSDNQRNPLALLDYFTDETETTKIFGNLSATLNIIEGLDYKFTFGVDRTVSHRGLAMSSLLNTNQSFGRGLAYLQERRFFNRLFENTLSYNKGLSERLNLQAVLGHSYETFDSYGESQILRDFTGYTDQKFYLDNIFAAETSAQQGERPERSSVTGIPVSLQSFFARTIWDLDNKYILTATLRADGSSRFGSNNKYGYFPSLAFGWKLAEEGFLPESVDDLKLRAGWGITGNQQFPSDASRLIFTPQQGGSAAISNSPNPDLKWETTTTTGIGLDFGFFNKLSGSFDWYSKKTEDLLFRLPVSQPGPPGAFFWNNFSDEVKSSGVELSLNYKIISNEDFSWEIGGNFAFLKNELIGRDAFKNGVSTGSAGGQGLSGERLQLLYGGQSLYAFYLPVFEGFDSSGNPTYADTNGDGVVNTNFDVPGGVSDRVFAGDPNPDVTMGINTNITYKDFDLIVNGYGAFGQQVYNNTANALFNASAFNRGENVTSNVPTNGENPASSPIISTRFLENADFFRLANVTLGYTFSSETLATINWIKSLRLYVTGQNLFVITNYSGFDPEVNTNKSVDGVPSFGIDYSSYPRSRSLTLGLSVNF
ncbi:SusC/RagA family TonB-linked outer membrane protein [Confluentibacter flavum]|uniref:SusC/RagA family TonB-linked outer membrane protein n=1 Tax=Confluentibacter flavum TaxID=1909700 RepID=A0A2N3HNQ0_9FLAO|nr:TonB-dependent receptor [Confluentibacter flavum]PKQ46590.1 SusC/RagA family TonB-linked outer membrane protein [Confluentibacter flavum]